MQSLCTIVPYGLWPTACQLENSSFEKSVENSLTPQNQVGNQLLDSQKCSKCFTVTAQKIHSALQDRLQVNANELWDISKELSRQINKSLTYSPQLENLKANPSSWLEVSPDSRKIEFIFSDFQLLNPQIVDPLSTKKVFNAYHLTFERVEMDNFPVNSFEQKTPCFTTGEENLLNTTSTQRIQYTFAKTFPVITPSVVIVPRDLDAIKHIERGIALQEKLERLLHKDRFPDIVKRLSSSSDSSNMPAPLYYQKRYTSDLKTLTASKNEKSFDHDKKIETLNLNQTLKIFIDISTFVKGCHKVKNVHCNIKPSNILVEISPDEKTSEEQNVKAFLSDYNLMQIAGPGSFSDSLYCDSIANQGFATPFTDVYSLALSLAEAVIPGFPLSDPEIFLNTKKYSFSDFAIDKDHAIALKSIAELIAKVIRTEKKLKSTFFVNSSQRFVSVTNNAGYSFTKNENAKKMNENRKNALFFLSQMDSLSPEEQWNHPLYVALEEPMQLDSLVTIDSSINQEIKLIKISDDGLILLVQKELEGLNDGNARRFALKKFLRKMLNNNDATDHIKEETKKIQDQIQMIESAMLFAINLRDHYRDHVADIMEKAMTMENFLNSLILIRQNLNIPAKY